MDSRGTVFGDIMSKDHVLQIFWMMHVGTDTTEESNWAIKRTKKVHVRYARVLIENLVGNVCNL